MHGFGTQVFILVVFREFYDLSGTDIDQCLSK